MVGAVDEGCVLYVRSQPAEPRADLRDVQSSFLRILNLFYPGAGLFPVLAGPLERSLGALAGSSPPNAPGPPGIEVPVEQARCGLMTVDIAHRMGRSVRVVDVSRELVSREVTGTPDGDEPFFPILVRPDGARLSGESDFTPGRVRKFLAGR